jgi:hypothetical protein
VRRGAAAIGIALLAAAISAAAVGDSARGERRQLDEVIVSLDADLAPLRLPRDRPAPVAVRFEGELRTDDGSALPRVTRVEIGLPSQGRVTTKGLPRCSSGQLRNAKPPAALAACLPALVGRGRLEASVHLPDQEPFALRAPLLLFNGRAGDGARAVLLYAFVRRPPTVVVLPFVLRRGRGEFTTVLAADLPPALGPWPHFARFELSLFRRYRFHGRRQSFLRASCPVPPRFTAGFFSLARARYLLADGRQLEVEIARGCRGL